MAWACVRSHGLCLRHLSGLPAAARAGLPGETLPARLALVGWELEGALRKRDGFARWAPAGQEASAWRRLPGGTGPTGGGEA